MITIEKLSEKNLYDVLFPLNVSVILKLVNQETSTNVISVGVCWFEF